MELLKTGFCDPNNLSQAYVLYDMSVTFTDITQMVDYIKAKGETVSTSTTGNVGDHYIYFNAPGNSLSFWGNFNSFFGVSGDGGALLSQTAFGGGTYKLQVPTGEFLLNNYSYISLNNSASLYFHLNPSTADVAGNYTCIRYSNGCYINFHSDSGGSEMHCFLENTGDLYFGFTTNNRPIGFIPPNGTAYNHIATLKNLKLYCIRSSALTMNGKVLDASGQPASNCKVYIYNRLTGNKVGQAISKADGTYKSLCAAKIGEILFAVCLDDDVLPDFEGIVIDRINVS
ncbi:carboxypeptidase-like regulatory domain-containing protein [Acinetobacter sp. AS167]|uniref:carboxypeptidase-like regulatory domain-containing protein n=1 Tax=Acinetobacter sp. AS167 TaxID=3127884 RepID=UPI00301B4C95